MNSFVFEFFEPYLQFAFGAAYTITQNLEGYGLSSSNFVEFDSTGSITGSYWSPEQAALIPFALLTFYLIFLLISLITSSFILGKYKGVIICIVVLMCPGILNLMGYSPRINYFPEAYVLGDATGELGSMAGFSSILLLSLITGWTFFINLYDILNQGDSFRQYFDHLWYCLAIIAGILFVYDSGANRNLKALQEEQSNAYKSSLYLLDQVKQYDKFCIQNKALKMASCQWASRVQQLLIEYSSYAPVLFKTLGPKDSKDIYLYHTSQQSDEYVLKIRSEIKEYNHSTCSRKYKKTIPSTCYMTPANFCRTYPDPPKGFVDEHMSSKFLVLATECIIPNLVRSREQQERLSKKARGHNLKKYERWLLFVFLAFIAGGKIANSSTKLAKIDSRPENQRRRIFKILSKIISLITITTKKTVKLHCHISRECFKIIIKSYRKVKTKNIHNKIQSHILKLFRFIKRNVMK